MASRIDRFLDPASGDTYQVNYTYRLNGEAHGSPVALYRRLRAKQPVNYGALIALRKGDPSAKLAYQGSGHLHVQQGQAGRLRTVRPHPARVVFQCAQRGLAGQTAPLQLPAATLNNSTSVAADLSPVSGQPAQASIYQLDGIVRRAPSLQLTADARAAQEALA